MTSYRKVNILLVEMLTKEKNLKNPFDKFPNCKLYSIELTPDENKRVHIIFIDDNASVLTKTREFFACLQN